jgi:hypothetical protein
MSRHAKKFLMEIQNCVLAHPENLDNGLNLCLNVPKRPQQVFKTTFQHAEKVLT